MKKTLLLIIALAASTLLWAQPAGYYDLAEGKTGEELKASLNDIIQDHVEYDYTTVWNILKNSDEDPANPNNVILLYSGRSRAKSHTDHGSSYDYESEGYSRDDSWNREHVWAKSHGDFGTSKGAGTDAHHLRPVDSNVNSGRNNRDFDNGGTQYIDDGFATGSYSDTDSWEPRDEVKGDVARMIFYMAVRYDGENGELDLKMVDFVNTYPEPEFGKLSVLLEWNQQDPPDDFERNRNEVVYSYQENRNPFIDNYQYANLIWGEAVANPISITNLSYTPNRDISATDEVTVTTSVGTSEGQIVSVNLNWGLAYESLTNTISMTYSDGVYSATIPANQAGASVYFAIEASTGQMSNTERSSYSVLKEFSGNITPISDVQGTGNDSPLAGETVTVSGIVTGNFGTEYYIQSGTAIRSAIMVYDSGRNPSLGDSVIVTGLVQEYYEQTELKEISEYILVSTGNPLPAAVKVSTATIATTSSTAEDYESMIVSIENATCTDTDAGKGMWIVDDASGECYVHNTSIFDYNPKKGETYAISGILKYDWENFKIELRGEDDVNVVVDNEEPLLLSFNVIDATHIELVFNEAISEASASNLANFSIDEGISVVGASQNTDLNIITLTVASLYDGSYHITLSNIADKAGNEIEYATVSFDYSSSAVLNQQILDIKFSQFDNSIVLKSEQGIRSVSVYAISGQLLRKQNINAQQAHLNSLPSGIFILKVETIDGIIESRKIVLQ